MARIVSEAFVRKRYPKAVVHSFKDQNRPGRGNRLYRVYRDSSLAVILGDAYGSASAAWKDVREHLEAEDFDRANPDVVALVKIVEDNFFIPDEESYAVPGVTDLGKRKLAKFLEEYREKAYDEGRDYGAGGL